MKQNNMDMTGTTYLKLFNISFPFFENPKFEWYKQEKIHDRVFSTFQFPGPDSNLIELKFNEFLKIILCGSGTYWEGKTRLTWQYESRHVLNSLMDVIQLNS